MGKKSEKKTSIVNNQGIIKPHDEKKTKKQAAKLKKVIKKELVEVPEPKSPKIGETTVKIVEDAKAAKLKKVIKKELVEVPEPKSPKIGESPVKIVDEDAKAAKKESKKQKKLEKKQKKLENKIKKEAISPENSPEKKVAFENGKESSEITENGIKTEEKVDKQATSSSPKKTPKNKKPVLPKSTPEKQKTLHNSPEHNVFVGNLPTNTKRVQLVKLFAPFGEVAFIRFRTANGKVIYKTKQRKASLTLNAYVVFAKAESAAKALELNGTKFKENILRVGKTDKGNENHNPKCTVFVGNLKYSATDAKLQQIFSSCGELEYVRTLQKPEGCIGVAYVCFKNPDSVGLALELNGTMLDERPINVERYSSNKLGAKEKRDIKAKMMNVGKKVLQKGKNDPDSFKKRTPGIGAKYSEKVDNDDDDEKSNGKKSFKKGSPNKNFAAGDKKKKSEFRGVKTEVIKKKPKKKVPSQMKKLASKIAPRDD